MSRRLTRSYKSEQEGVDMTPMLDIVFILLIFFIAVSYTHLTLPTKA